MKVYNPNNLPTKPIADLLPTQGDLKDLTDKNYKKLKNTIDKRGFSVPVYVWEDDKQILHLLDGHQRRRVLTTEGWNEPIPYLKVPAKDLQEAMARLLEITSQYGTITQEGIDEFIGKYDLPEAEIYEATHFDAIIPYQTETETEVEEDDAPEVSSKPPVSQLGKIYQLGNHRVMCGDSTDFGAVSDLIDGKEPNMVLTDPPYGMNLQTGMSNITNPKDKWINKKKNYDTVIGDDEDYDPAHIFEMFSNCKEIFLWGADYYAERIPDKNAGSFFVWDKRAGLEQVEYSLSSFEICWSKQKHRRDIIRVKWFGLAGTETQDIRERIHPTQKPVEVSTFFLNKFGSKDDIVVDLFLGSGSTLIACEQTDRICYGIELDPKYVDVIRKRWAKYCYPDTWEERWEELTPAISGAEQVV